LAATGRTAAKLTGWRIDIKSLAEAAADALGKLQHDPALAELAEAERERTAAAEAVLAKKSEGRPVTPEEYASLVQFLERVERRTVEKKKAEAAAEEERLTAAKAGIPQAAYEAPLETLGLAEHVCNILTEAELRTIGDLMLMMNLDRDRVLGLAGIGPKSMQAIEAALAAVTFPEPEPAPAEEPVVEAAAEAAVPLEVPAQAGDEVPVEAAAEPTAEPAEKSEEEAPAEAEGEKEFEKMFSLQNVVAATAPVTGEEDESPKKKEKKQRKDRAYERDETRDKVVAVKIHKRGDDAAVEEDW
jgi:N utilization substance protein A